MSILYLFVKPLAQHILTNMFAGVGNKKTIFAAQK